MSGYFWGYRWVSDKQAKGLLARQWDRLFKNRAPLNFELSDAATLLKQLSESPHACAFLAAALEVEVDAGDSAADVVSQMASQAGDEAMRVYGQMEINRIRKQTGSQP